jgi:hypothetical protein
MGADTGTGAGAAAPAGFVHVRLITLPTLSQKAIVVPTGKVIEPPKDRDALKINPFPEDVVGMPVKAVIIKEELLKGEGLVCIAR